MVIADARPIAKRLSATFLTVMSSFLRRAVPDDCGKVIVGVRGGARSPSPSKNNAVSCEKMAFGYRYCNSNSGSDSAFGETYKPFAAFSSLASRTNREISVRETPRRSISDTGRYPICSFNTLSASVALVDMGTPSDVAELGELPEEKFCYRLT